MRVTTVAIRRRYDYAADLTLHYNVFLLAARVRTAR